MKGESCEMTMTADTPPIETFLKHQAWLRKKANQLVQDPGRSDDIVQQIWLDILRFPPKKVRFPQAWLKSLLVNKAKKMWKDEAIRRRMELFLATEPGENSKPPAVDDEGEDSLIRRIARLPSIYRDALRLHFFEGLSPSEIAARLGQKRATVYKRLQRGLGQLSMRPEKR